jgi:hypothetical protein
MNMTGVSPSIAPSPCGYIDDEGIETISIESLSSILRLSDPADDLVLHVPPYPLNGHMQMTELSALIYLIRGTRAATFLEIGTFDGLVVQNVLTNCPSVTAITTIDLPNELHQQYGIGLKYDIDRVNAEMLNTVQIGARFANHPRNSIVKQLRIDSALLTAEVLSPPKFDTFLIDGCHTYEYCKGDSEFAAAHLRSGGFVMWHDFGKLHNLGGVTQYLLELAHSKRFTLYRIKCPSFLTSLVIGFRTSDASTIHEGST